MKQIVIEFFRIRENGKCSSLLEDNMRAPKAYLMALAMSAISSVPALAGSGYIYPGGPVDIFNSDGSFSHGQINPGGSMDIFNSDGSFSHGQVNPGGSMDIFKSDGSFSHGQIDE